ncbi:hypothetical protein Tco_1559747, partial [Tanacetum coccineum]
MNRRSREKHVALIRFVWRMKENDRSGWLCFLDRWKSALGTSLDEDVRGGDVMITETHGIALIGKGMVVKTKGNGETTRCEHYGSGSSNQVALDVVGEEVVGPGEVEMEMNVSNGMP